MPDNLVSLLLGPLGLLFATIFVLWRGSKGDWYYGDHHREVVATLKDGYESRLKDALAGEAEWKELAMSNTPVLERTVGLAEAVIRKDG